MRVESIRRGRQLAIGISLALSIAACGGGGGGGGGTSAAVQQSQNAAPKVQAGTDQTIELPTASAQLTGSATDDASQTLTYSWTATSGPSGVTFGTANAAATSVTFPSAGAYVLTLSVSDGSLSATDTVSVTVNAATYPASDTTNDTTDHGWARVAAAADVGMTQAGLDQAATYAQTSGRSNPADNAGMIVRHGRIVTSWGDIDKRYDMKSTTKSMGGIALGIAYDNKSILLSDTAKSHYADFGAKPVANLSTGPGWVDSITIQQLATHTAGFTKYAGWGVSLNDSTTTTLLYQPGTTWSYSDSGLNWLAEVLTTVFNEDLATVLGTRVWTALGLNSSYGSAGGGTTSDVHWRDNANRPQLGAVPHKRELASGIFANANAMARVGQLFLRKGVWANDQRVLSEEFVNIVKTPVAANASLANPKAADFPNATVNYGVLWWTNANGQLPNVPKDAYWAWGLGDSLIVVIPSLDIVVVRAGAQFIADPDPSPGVREWNDADWNGDYAVLAPFLDPIVQSVTP